MRSPQPRSRERARRGGRVAAVLGGLLALSPGRAAAMPTIDWEAPTGCPSAARVKARIGEVVGARPVSPAVTAVRARVERQGGGWLLVVVFSGRDGTTERRLTLHDCEATANATALLVGIALVGPASGAAPDEVPLAVPVPDREAKGGARAAETEDVEAKARGRAGEAGTGERGGTADGAETAGAARGRAAVEVGARGRAEGGAGVEGDARGRAGDRAGVAGDARGRAADGAGVEGDARGRAANGGKKAVGADAGGRGRAGDALAAAAADEGRSTAARARAFVQVGPALAVGVLPRAAAGLTAALGVAWPRLRLALGYAGWFRSPARWPEDRQIGADLSLHAGSLRIGPVRRVGPVELQAALGLEAGGLRAAGVGSEINLDGRTWWGATLLGGALAWAPRALRGHGALRVEAELVVPLHRPTLVYNREPIFRLGAVGLRAGLQLEARFF
ncbi:hypothetical protein SAMN02745121_03205 [Nannocystis exedens]|uniref:Uncharacterized protein n=1 Tax=Nannocystis exedens TaxID=54 RepID=A0A1I1Y6N8_9BACT|nr:hypothetical protein [Nannocystis exedens]PCC71853.1 hypothetical protein NAEX_04932 [Nannocystis exedens]SFE15247.1 hypothetical protein SAMN02745121_03205 [Nannocystis exedens]